MVFFSSILLASSATPQQCIVLQFFCEVRVWTWFEVWCMNTFCEVWACEVKGSFTIVAVLEAFSFIDFVVSYVLSLVVYNVDPSLSLATPTISKAFSFADLSIFTILIVDPTFSLASLVVSKAFCFVSSIVEPTLSFASATFSWAFSVVSSIFYYTIPKNSATFYFNCSKIELALKSYSSWASSFPTSSSLCGFSFDVPKVEEVRSLTWPAFSFSNFNCLKHLLSNNVLHFTYPVICCFLWGWRSQVEGVKLKFEGLRYEVIVSSLKCKSLIILLGLRFESLITLLSLNSLCQAKGPTKLKVWALSI